MKVQEQFKRDFALKVKSVAESIEEVARDDYEGLGIQRISRSKLGNQRCR